MKMRGVDPLTRGGNQSWPETIQLIRNQLLTWLLGYLVGSGLSRPSYLQSMLGVLNPGNRGACDRPLTNLGCIRSTHPSGTQTSVPELGLNYIGSPLLNS